MGPGKSEGRDSQKADCGVSKVGGEPRDCKGSDGEGARFTSFAWYIHTYMHTYMHAYIDSLTIAGLNYQVLRVSPSGQVEDIF